MGEGGPEVSGNTQRPWSARLSQREPAPSCALDLLVHPEALGLPQEGGTASAFRL